MEKVSNIKKYLFISVKPEFANKIIAKEKCIELRKIKPHVKAGDYITEENIRSVRPGYGIACKNYYSILGKRFNRSAKFGTALTWDIID